MCYSTATTTMVLEANPPVKDEKCNNCTKEQQTGQHGPKRKHAAARDNTSVQRATNVKGVMKLANCELEQM